MKTNTKKIVVATAAVVLGVVAFKLIVNHDIEVTFAREFPGVNPKTLRKAYANMTRKCVSGAYENIDIATDATWNEAFLNEVALIISK